MLPISAPDPSSETPLYRQLHAEIKHLIESGAIPADTRLPATRELAGHFGLNRTTVSAAYALLENDGLITGHVGRGSFVARRQPSQPRPTHLNWRALLDPPSSAPAVSSPAASPIATFSSSRPAEALFPVEEFRATCAEVIAGAEAQNILQLGSPSGYPPLRRYLLDIALAEGVARDSDDILITSGCQQAFDLIQRAVVRHSETVLVEDPVYPGVKNVFNHSGARLIGVPMTPDGIDIDALQHIVERERPRLLAVTPNFQNPTGATLPLAERKALLRIAQSAGMIVVENDVYGPLAYQGDSPPPIKSLDHTGHTVLLRSFSKIAFPGLRVGWVVAPRALIEKLTEIKQWTDLHSDQLSQAVLLRFAESGRLEKHRQQVLAAGRERLAAVLNACEKYLPAEAQFTRPRGGMSLWIRLPEPLDTAELLPRAERQGVSYVPGKYFAVSHPEPNGLRISFAGMDPERIRSGIAILGQIFKEELERVRAYSPLAGAPALV